MKKIRKNDNVVVISGKDKGKKGKVERVLVKESQVVVGGANLYKRHLKRKSEKEQSQIVTIAKPLNLSKVMLVCPKCNLPTRATFETDETGKHRACKKCKKTI